MAFATYLSPNGRLSRVGFRPAALALFVVGGANSLLQTLDLPTWVVSTCLFAGLAMLYAFVVLWIRRLHEGAMSGWLVIPVLLIWFVSTVLSYLVLVTAFSPVMQEVMAGADMQALSNLDVSAGMVAQNEQLSLIAGTGVAFVVAMVMNQVLRTDPNDNEFGPAPRSRSDT